MPITMDVVTTSTRLMPALDRSIVEVARNASATALSTAAPASANWRHIFSNVPWTTPVTAPVNECWARQATLYAEQLSATGHQPSLGDGSAGVRGDGEGSV